ncbi:hypothetical protein V5E97_01630 [Singulisphaera sp. Ch08]|uniref:Uncharacterized protein n=1 Tax=Singulisphaera sp. Ch08 TaxID=3120278 RepID=A0AAU7CIK7_9BACT
MRVGTTLKLAAVVLGVGLLAGNAAQAQGITSTTFRVKDMTGGKLAHQKILVFLTPKTNAEDFVFAAWQQLSPGENSTHTFVLNQAVSGQVTTVDSSQETAVVPIAPGYMSTITDADNLGIVLSKSSLAYAESESLKVTPSQSGIINNTATPPLATKVRWFVNDSLTAESRTFLPAGGALSTFELDTKLYWTVGSTVKAPAYTYQQIDPLLTYDLPPNTPSVDVLVTFDDASQTFKFGFTPSSAP